MPNPKMPHLAGREMHRRYGDDAYDILDDQLQELIDEFNAGVRLERRNIHGIVCDVTIYPTAWATGALMLQGLVHPHYQTRASAAL